MLNVGDDAPEFKVKTHAGEFISLSDFRGRKVVLWFYPKADTPGCTAEGCGFRDRFAQFREKNAVVLGVSFDNEEANRDFARKFDFPFTLLCDTERDIGLAYGACRTETDANATRIAYVINEKGIIEKAYPKVDAKSFPETVLADMA